MDFYNLPNRYNLTEKGWSLDLTVIFLRSGTPTKVRYDVQQTMIFLICGAISVCNFFLTIVNKFLVYTSIDLIFFFQHICCVRKWFLSSGIFVPIFFGSVVSMQQRHPMPPTVNLCLSRCQVSTDTVSSNIA